VTGEGKLLLRYSFMAVVMQITPPHLLLLSLLDEDDVGAQWEIVSVKVKEEVTLSFTFYW